MPIIGAFLDGAAARGDRAVTGYRYRSAAMAIALLTLYPSRSALPPLNPLLRLYVMNKHPAAMRQPVQTLSGRHRTNRRVLHDVSFSIGEGEMMAIALGSSGSGKSTLLHLLGGLDTPTLWRCDF